jgi:hypothetical protein
MGNHREYGPGVALRKTVRCHSGNRTLGILDGTPVCRRSGMTNSSAGLASGIARTPRWQYAEAARVPRRRLPDFSVAVACWRRPQIARILEWSGVNPSSWTVEAPRIDLCGSGRGGRHECASGATV